MSTKSYQSSPQVMFSDKGSVFFGIFLILSMVVLSFSFFIIRFKDKPKIPKKEFKAKSNLVKMNLAHSKSKHFLLLHYPQNLSKKSTKKIKLKEK